MYIDKKKHTIVKSINFMLRTESKIKSMKGQNQGQRKVLRGFGQNKFQKEEICKKKNNNSKKKSNF